MSRQCSTRGSDQEWMGYTLLLEKLFGRERLAYPAAYCKSVWIVFIWHRIGTRGRLL
jgi:hypothetical protein